MPWAVVFKSVEEMRLQKLISKGFAAIVFCVIFQTSCFGALALKGPNFIRPEDVQAGYSGMGWTQSQVNADGSGSFVHSEENFVYTALVDSNGNVTSVDKADRLLSTNSATQPVAQSPAEGPDMGAIIGGSLAGLAALGVVGVGVKAVYNNQKEDYAKQMAKYNEAGSVLERKVADAEARVKEVKYTQDMDTYLADVAKYHAALAEWQKNPNGQLEPTIPVKPVPPVMPVKPEGPQKPVLLQAGEQLGEVVDSVGKKVASASAKASDAIVSVGNKVAGKAVDAADSAVRAAHEATVGRLFAQPASDLASETSVEQLPQGQVSNPTRTASQRPSVPVELVEDDSGPANPEAPRPLAAAASLPAEPGASQPSAALLQVPATPPSPRGSTAQASGQGASVAEQAQSSVPQLRIGGGLNNTLSGSSPLTAPVQNVDADDRAREASTAAVRSEFLGGDDNGGPARLSEEIAKNDKELRALEDRYTSELNPETKRRLHLEYQQARNRSYALHALDLRENPSPSTSPRPAKPETPSAAATAVTTSIPAAAKPGGGVGALAAAGAANPSALARVRAAAGRVVDSIADRVQSARNAIAGAGQRAGQAISNAADRAANGLLSRRPDPLKGENVSTVHAYGEALAARRDSQPAAAQPQSPTRTPAVPLARPPVSSGQFNHTHIASRGAFGRQAPSR